MASNFHDIFGFLAIGVDVHKGLRPVPAPPGFIPELFAEVVAIHPFILGPGQKPTVKFNGVNSVVDGHTSYVSWPHFPIAPPNILFPIDLIFGTHSCWLPRCTVQVCGELSTCAMAGPVSMDLDCWEWAPIPSDLTLQRGTVHTTPSLADFQYGLIRAVVNGAISFLTSQAFKLLGKIKIGKVPISKITEGWADRIGNSLTKKGLGYQFARAVGGPLMASTLAKIPNASRQKISGASWAAGRRIINAAIGKVLPGSLGGATSTGLSAFNFNPGKVVANHVVGAPPGTDPAAAGSWNPFGSFKGPGMLDRKVPLYGAIHGGVQAVGGP